jgi:tetratricopeptide (TPR) repeat protein
MQTRNRTWALYISLAVLVFPLAYLVLKNNPSKVNQEEKTNTSVPLNDSTEMRFQGLISGGLENLNADRLDASVQLFEEAVKLRPNSEIALNNLGFAWCKKGDFDKGAAYIKAALTFKPDFQLAKNNLAWAQGELSKKQIHEGK